MTVENWINLGSLIVAIVSALVAAGSLWFTFIQWQKIKRKIGMINDSGKAIEILPAWYTTSLNNTASQLILTLINQTMFPYTKPSMVKT